MGFRFLQATAQLELHRHTAFAVDMSFRFLQSATGLDLRGHTGFPVGMAFRFLQAAAQLGRGGEAALAVGVTRNFFQTANHFIFYSKTAFTVGMGLFLGELTGRGLFLGVALLRMDVYFIFFRNTGIYRVGLVTALAVGVTRNFFQGTGKLTGGSVAVGAMGVLAYLSQRTQKVPLRVGAELVVAVCDHFAKTAVPVSQSVPASISVLMGLEGTDHFGYCPDLETAFLMLVCLLAAHGIVLHRNCGQDQRVGRTEHHGGCHDAEDLLPALLALTLFIQFHRLLQQNVIHKKLLC